jgi:hypothetical protein
VQAGTWQGYMPYQAGYSIGVEGGGKERGIGLGSRVSTAEF